jgi:hypothetical protein
MRTASLLLSITLLSVTLVAGATACGGPEPVAPLEKATSSAGLRVRIIGEGGAAPAARDPAEVLRAAFTSDLRQAGYVVVASDQPFDLTAAIHVNAEARSSGENDYRGATLLLVSATEEPIDQFRLAFSSGEAPASEPARVSHLLVNAVVGSANVAKLAAATRSAREPH